MFVGLPVVQVISPLFEDTLEADNPRVPIPIKVPLVSIPEEPAFKELLEHLAVISPLVRLAIFKPALLIKFSPLIDAILGHIVGFRWHPAFFFGWLRGSPRDTFLFLKFFDCIAHGIRPFFEAESSPFLPLLSAHFTVVISDDAASVGRQRHPDFIVYPIVSLKSAIFFFAIAIAIVFLATLCDGFDVGSEGGVSLGWVACWH